MTKVVNGAESTGHHMNKHPRLGLHSIYEKYGAGQLQISVGGSSRYSVQGKAQEDIFIALD